MKKFIVNKGTTRKMVQCVSKVCRSDVVRKSINGVEHIIVSSFTLPDNVVMNDGLYPADEIERGYKSLERTLAPIEHPTDSQGNYISAMDPEAIHNFHAGAFNVNVRRIDGRVCIDKHINVQEAMKTDRGKRLLDRINELETSDKPRPLHTSVGVFLTVEDLKEPRVNASGDKYTWIAHDMVFDHDAILLDSQGAATPEQGVGMAVNSDGDQITVDRVFIDNTVRAATDLPLADSNRTWDKAASARRVREHVGAVDAPNTRYARYHLWYDSGNADNFGAYKLPFVDIIDGEPKAVPSALRNAAARLNQTDGPSDAEKTRIRGIIDGYLEKLRTNAAEGSVGAMMEKLEQAIRGVVAYEWMYLVDVFDDYAIFETNDGYFRVPFEVRNNEVVLSGIPIRVDKMVEYQPKLNSNKGEEQMKELILNALAGAGISTDGLSDEQLLEAYQKLLKPETDNDSVAEVITNAIKPLSDKVEALTVQVNARNDEERNGLIAVIVNSKKYPGITEESAKLLPVEALKEMAGACGTSHGVPFTVNVDGEDDRYKAPAEMPE